MADGKIHQLLDTEKVSNGVKGFNSVTVNVAYTGGIDAKGNPTDNRTEEQKASLRKLLKLLKGKFPDAVIQGHRDFSPDKNGNGVVDEMKMTTRLLIFLFALCLCGCKTKQKVTENLTETAQASCSSVQLTTGQTEQEGQATTQEETMHTQWSDSIVERFHERVVTDSTGRVLLHEVEHSKDTYKGRQRKYFKKAQYVKFQYWKQYWIYCRSVQ